MATALASRDLVVLADHPEALGVLIDGKAYLSIPTTGPHGRMAYVAVYPRALDELGGAALELSCRG
jgi:hypothetical protein